ncbi:outer membrane protein [Helicobacter sp. L8]|uniref:outer membrane protein n=1 Tax=Helicobacter sp. L8 TaxID=2316078 RepID=UPI000EB4B7EF|nr:outer membrane protein [Helicobacter sp. L8]
MQVFNNRGPKRVLQTLGVSIAACLSLSPVDATEITAEQMVDSISGILGGNYTVGGPASGASYGSSLTPTIYIPTASGTDPINAIGSGTTYTNPTNPAVNYQLYGNGGLLTNYDGSTYTSTILQSNGGSWTNPYDLDAVSSLINPLYALYSQYYGYRNALAGISASKNIFGQAISNPYYTLTPGTLNSTNTAFTSAASVTGNLSASMLANASDTSTANGLLTTIYTNITKITNDLGYLVTPGQNFAPTLDSNISTIASVGSSILDALSATSSSPSSTQTLGASLTNLNQVLYGSSTNTLFTSTTASTGSTYAVQAGSLTTLQDIANVNSLVSGGLTSTSTSGGTTTYAMSSGYTSVLKAFNGNANFLADANAITNNVLNTATLSEVLSKLSSLNTVAYNTDVASALQGLVNPNSYEVVFKAYGALFGNTGTITQMAGALNTSSSSSASTSAQQLLNAVQIFNDINTIKTNLALGSNVANNATLGTAAFTAGASPTLSNDLAKVLYEAFNNGSASSYANLQSTISAINTLVAQNTNYVSSNTTKTTAANAGSFNTSTQYPVQSYGGATAASYPITTSYTTQGALNQSTYNTKFNANLATLLSNVLSYSANTNALGKLLSSNTSLSSILTQGIYNAAANQALNSGATQSNTSGDNLNNQALYLNQMRAIFMSENLLNTYVDAITSPQSAQSNQVGQADALNTLSGALNASAQNNGLIAQAKAALVNQLNSSQTYLSSGAVTNLTPTAIATLEGLSSPDSVFASTATPSSIVTGLDAMNALAGYFSGVTNTAPNKLTDGVKAANAVITALSTIASSTVAPTYSTNTGLAGALSTATSTNDTVMNTVVTNWDALSKPVQEAFDTLVGATWSATAGDNKSNSTTNAIATLVALLTTDPIATNNASTMNTLITNLGTNISGATSPGTVAANISNIDAILPSSVTGGVAGAAFASSQIASQLLGAAGSDQNNLTLQLINSLAAGRLFSPSVATQFQDGTLSLKDLSQTINTIASQIQQYNALGATAPAGTASSATPPVFTPAAPTLSNSQIQGFLKTAGVSAVQNLGFADASVQSLNTSLTSVVGLVSTGNSTSAKNISDLSSDLSALNSAVQGLYSASKNFFNNGNLSDVSNVYAANQPTSQGLGDSSVGMAANANASNYLTNLNNLGTINNLVGVLNSAGTAVSTQYSSAFASGGPVSTVQAQYSALTTNLVDGATLTQVIQALQPLSASASSAAVQAALTNIISTPSSNAAGVWTAYKAVVGLGTSSNPVSQLNNLLANKLDITGSNSAANIAQVIQDANTLSTANTALTGNVTGANSGLLSVSSTNAAAFQAAIKAASALSPLWSALSDGTAANALSLLQNLNIYAHNVQLLNNLTGGSTNGKGDDIASLVLGNVQATNALSATGASGLSGASGIQTLQRLVQRLQYLEGLNQQVQNAIDSNPYAMVMQKNNITSSAAYQNAAKALVGSGGLFNSSAGIGSVSSDTASINSSYSTFASGVSADLGYLSTWNSMIAGLSSSSGILNSASNSFVGTANTQLTSILKQVSTIADYLPAGTITNGQNSNTSTLSGINTAWSTISGQAANLGNSNLYSVSSPAAAATTSTQLLGDLTTTNFTNVSVLQGLDSILQLNKDLVGGVVTGTAGSYSIGTNVATLSTANTLFLKNSATDSGSVASILTTFNTAITSSGANAGSLVGLTPNALTTLFATGSSTTGTTSGTFTSASVIGDIIQALAKNSTTSQYLQGLSGSPAALPTANTDQSKALATAVQSALTPILGATNAGTIKGDVAASAPGDVVAWMTALNALITQLKDVNGVIINKVDSSAGIGPAIAQVLTNVQNVDALYQTATATMAGAFTTIPNLATLQTIVAQAQNLFNDQGGSFAGPVSASAALSTLAQDVGDDPTGTAGSVSMTGLSASTATSAIQLLAVQLKANGVSGSTVGAILGTASATQMDQAVSQVLSSPNLSASMKTGLVYDALQNILNAAKTYSGASATLAPLLNSTSSVSAITNNALNNAQALNALLKVLNDSNSYGISLAQAQKSLGLSPTQIATITKLLTSMNTMQGRVSAVQQAIASNPTAQALLQADTDATKAATLLTSLTTVGGAYSSSMVSNYLDAQNTVITAQANYLADSGTTTLGTLMASLKNFVTDNNPLGNASLEQAVQNVYNQIIASPTINPTLARANLSNLITQLQNFQQSLANDLGALIQANAPATTAVVGVARVDGVQAMVLPRAGSNHSGFPGGNNPVQQAQSLKNALTAVNQALVYAKASLSKLETQLKSYYTATTTRPMQTMNSNGNMYGIDVQFGYKQFFGKKKRWGLRYYASFSWQHGTFMDGDTSELDNFVYGAGVDALYNFYESKDAKYTSGLFAGFMLAGSTWNVKGASAWISRMNRIKAQGGSAQMNTSYFQIPLNIGFRTNVSKHHGFEIGLRIPLAVNYYFKGTLGDETTTIAYKRNVSVFFNYVYNF